jgi:hypothetical protein
MTVSAALILKGIGYRVELFSDLSDLLIDLVDLGLTFPRGFASSSSC